MKTNSNGAPRWLCPEAAKQFYHTQNPYALVSRNGNLTDMGMHLLYCTACNRNRQHNLRGRKTYSRNGAK